MGLIDDFKSWLVVKVLKGWYDKLDGKKTYIIMAVGILMAGIDVWNSLCGEQFTWCKDLVIPPWVFAVLFSLGIYTRSQAKPK